MKKPTIIFVGSFAHLSKSDHVGGMTKMCQYILDSYITEEVNWQLIDSTAPHNNIRSFFQRLLPALKRLLVFVWMLLTKRVDSVFVFTSQGLGFYEKGLMIVMAKIFKKRTVLALRSGFLMKDVRQSEAFKKRAQLIFKMTDQIVCQGTNWLEFLKDEFGIEKVKVVIIPNCIDVPKTNIDTNVSDPVRLLFMGFVEKNKGVFELVNALKKVEQKNWQLDIAGNGISLQDIKKLVHTLGLDDRVNFHDWVRGEVKENLLVNADIIILPSYYEGMPNVLLEAMARCTAVLSTNVGAIPDLIDSGVNGYLTEPGELDQLAENISIYLQNPELIMQHKEASKLKIEKGFTVERIIPKFARILLVNNKDR